MGAPESATQAADRRALVTGRALAVIGAGEHARVVIESARSIGSWDGIGVVDKAPIGNAMAALDVALLGDDDAFVAQLEALDARDRPALLLGVGATPGADVRQALARRYDGLGRWATVIDPGARISPSAQVGAGSVVLVGAIVNGGARLGAHVIVNSGAIVEHDTVLGDFVHVAPGAVLGGGVRIEAGAFVGLGSLVRDHVTIGSGAVLAMGAVVTADVPAGTVVRSPRVERAPTT
jgi:acetyltransferase EpsM